MNVFGFCFSPRGRISRSRFWLGMLGVFCALAVAFGFAFLTSFAYAAAPFILFAFVSTYILAIKRLHDRNKSGWWTLVFLWTPGVLDRISNKVAEDSAIWWVLVLAGAALSLWGLIELGFRRGTDGANDYGPDPLGKTDQASPTEPAKA